MAFAGSYGPGATYAWSSAQDNNLLTTSLYTDYFKSFNKNNFKVMVGFNTELYKQNYVYAKRDDVISDEVPSIDASMGKDYTSANKKEWATAGFFGRLNYDYDGRYLAEINIRYDGSSRFLRDKRWNVFPSFSLGYNIAREAFWEDLSEYVGTLKPRFSWGKLGNQNTKEFYPFYPAQPLGLKNGKYLIGGQQPTTATAPLMVSDLMTWEKITTTNIGFDFGALNNRLTGSFEWYMRKTDDMVGPPEEKSPIIGIDNDKLPRINNAAMQSKGWELALTWNDQIGKVGYTVGFTLADAVPRSPNTRMMHRSSTGRIRTETWNTYLTTADTWVTSGDSKPSALPGQTKKCRITWQRQTSHRSVANGVQETSCTEISMVMVRSRQAPTRSAIRATARSSVMKLPATR